MKLIKYIDYHCATWAMTPVFMIDQFVTLAPVNFYCSSKNLRPVFRGNCLDASSKRQVGGWLSYHSSGFDGPIEALGNVDENGNAVHKMWADEVSENPVVGATEVWEFFNLTADAHPMHIPRSGRSFHTVWCLLTPGSLCH